MKPLHFAVLGAVLVVLAFLFLMNGDDEGPRRSRSDETNRTSRTTGDAGGPSDEEAKEVEQAPTTGDLDITVKVVLADGSAALGANLRLDGVPERTATADETGAAKIAGLAAGFYNLYAEKDGAVAATSFELEKTLDLGTLRLVESVRISGHVYDPQREGVAGAVVEAVVATRPSAMDFGRMIEMLVRPDAVVAATKSGPDGAYEIAVPKGEAVALRVIAAGYAQEGEAGRAYVVDTERLDFHLYRGSAIAGVVIDTEGKPIVGARVMVTNPMTMFAKRMAKTETSTGIDGAFTLSVAPSQQMMITARAPGYALHMNQVKFPATALRITLEAGMQLRLRAVDADNPHPAPDVNVLIIYNGSFASGRTNELGELHIAHLPTRAGGAMGRQRQAIMTGGGYVPNMVSLASLEAVDGVLDVGDVKLKRGGTINGRVLNSATGEVVPGVRVRAFGGLDMQLQFIGSVPVTTNEKGEFELIGVPLGASMLLANHPDYVTEFDMMGFAMARQGGKPLFPEGKTEVQKDISLNPAAVVTGVVVDPEGVPVPGATVGSPAGGEQMMLGMMGLGPSEAISDAEGKFRMRGLKEGKTVKLVAKHREYGSSLAVSVKPGSGVAVTLQLEAPIRLHGVVVDERGAFVEGVRVTVQRKGQGGGRGMMSPMNQDQGMTRPAVTDEKGEYIIRDAPSGSLELSFEHAQYEPAKREITVVAGTPVLEVDRVTLSRGIGIEGIVVNEKGEPVPGVAVNVNTMGQLLAGKTPKGRRWATDVTDEQGKFSVYGLSDGEFNVQPYSQGSYGAQQHVKAGTMDVRLVLRPAVEFKGHVTANGEPVVGASVRLEDPSANAPEQGYRRFMGYARTDAQGNFVVTPLPPDGRFTVVIEHDGYAARRVEGASVGGGVREFTLDVGVRVGGLIVDNNGDPVSNGRLTISVAGNSKSVRAGPDGKWVAGGLGDGDITVHVAGWAGFVKQEPIPVTPGDLDIRIVVERGESISGTITGGEDEALRGIRVEAIDEAGEVASTTWVWQNNRSFQLRGLRRGKYTIKVSRMGEGAFKTVAESEVIASDTEDVEIAIK